MVIKNEDEDDDETMSKQFEQTMKRLVFGKLATEINSTKSSKQLHVGRLKSNMVNLPEKKSLLDIHGKLFKNQL